MTKKTFDNKGREYYKALTEKAKEALHGIYIWKSILPYMKKGTGKTYKKPIKKEPI